MESNRCANCGAPRRANDECCPYCNTLYPKNAQSAATSYASYVPPVNSFEGSSYDAPSQQGDAGQAETPVSQGTSRRFIAALLALLGGTFGLHWFYLGRIGRGILYACFCATIIPTILGAVRGISWLLMSDQEFDRRY